MNLTKEARRIIDLLKNNFVFEDGSFFLEKNEDNIFPHTIHADLGDFLPFFLYFGEDSFVEKQIALYEGSLKNGLLVSEFPSFGIRGLVKSYEYTDLLLGLLDLYELRDTEKNKKLLIDTADKIIKIFQLEGRFSSYYYPKLNIRIPFVDTRDGTLIELFIDLHGVIGEQKYFFVANNIFNKLINIPFYKKNSLLPNFATFFGGIGKKFNTANICKNNTNSVFGFLSIAKNGNENAFKEIDKILEKLKEVSGEVGGGIPFTYSPAKKSTEANLTASFPIVDFLCDLYHERRKEEYIDFAKQIADFWISKQGGTGLFPLHSNQTESFFDSETDMSVALYKLWEKSGDEKYKKAADFCFGGILEFHGKNDYPLSVDINTGKVLNKTQRTKFLTLFLKLIILQIEYEKGLRIFSDKKLFNLLRDR